MIHCEEFERLFPSLRLPRNFIRKATSRIEMFGQMREVMGDRVNAWLDAHMLCIEHFKHKGAEWGAHVAAAMENNLYLLVRYIRAGEHAFSVERNLADLLSATDLPEIAADEFHLPFPAMYIEFPKMFVTRFTDGEAPLVGCYIADCRPVHEQLLLCVATVPGRHIDPFGGLVGPFILPLPRGKMADFAYLRRMVQSVSLGDAKDAQFQTLTNQLVPIDHFMEALVRVIVNTILYTTSANPDLVEVVSEWRRLRGEFEQSDDPKRRRKLAARIDGANRTERVILGRSITFSYGRPLPGDTSTEATEARMLLDRHEVRGHWKRQTYGTNAELRKRIFIAPYWRGPEDLAAALAKRYKVK